MTSLSFTSSLAASSIWAQRSHGNMTRRPTVIGLQRSPVLAASPRLNTGRGHTHWLTPEFRGHRGHRVVQGWDTCGRGGATGRFFTDTGIDIRRPKVQLLPVGNSMVDRSEITRPGLSDRPRGPTRSSGWRHDGRYNCRYRELDTRCRLGQSTEKSPGRIEDTRTRYSRQRLNGFKRRGGYRVAEEPVDGPGWLGRVGQGMKTTNTL